MASFHTTEDKTRYARMCRILVDVTGNIFREELLKHIQPTDIKMRIKQSIIHSVRSKYKPFKHVIDTAHNDGYAKFDISILYVLLRNLCLELEQPTGGWDNRNKSTTSGEDRPISPISGKPFPYHKESTLGDDIERIHLTRNDLDHLGAASLTDSEYSFYFDQMENVCNRMDVRHFTNGKRNYWNALEVIENCPMDDKSIQVYIEHIGLAKAVEENIAQKGKEKNALDILLERSEYVIADQRSRGSKFVETNLYMKCKEALTESRTLFISGNPGEGKTRCAIELLCSVANKSERLFLNDPNQLNSIDLKAIRGIVIDNIYGDVAYDGQHWKSWKRQLQYIIPMSKERKENPLYVFITSRTYIAKACADPLQIKTVKLVTDDLDQDSKLKMLEAYTSSVDTDLIVSKFSSDIYLGFPQICYLFSIVKEFQDMGEKYFETPNYYLFTLLEQFKKGKPIDLFTLFMIVYQKGSMNIHTLENSKIAELSNSVGLNFGRQDIRSSLEKFTGSFLSFDEIYNVHSLSHDSLFDAILGFSAEKYPIPLIETAELQILINHVCVEGQSAVNDTMRVYIKESLAEKLSERYVHDFLREKCKETTLVQSNVLYSKRILIHFLQNLDSNKKLESFLRFADANESLLVEYSYYGMSELSEILLHSMKRFRGTEWAKEQVCTAMTISRQFGHDSTRKLLEETMGTFSIPEERVGTKLENIKDDGSESGISSDSDEENDEPFIAIKLIYYINEGKFKKINDMVKSRKVSYVDIENEALRMIRLGADVDSVVPRYLENSDECLYHSLIHCNIAAFSTLLEARSTNFDMLFFSDYMIKNLNDIICRFAHKKLHLVYVFCKKTGLWDRLHSEVKRSMLINMDSDHALKEILFFNQRNECSTKHPSNRECFIPTSVMCSMLLRSSYDMNIVMEPKEIIENENNSFKNDLSLDNAYGAKMSKCFANDSRFLGLVYLLALRSWSKTSTSHTLLFSLQEMKIFNPSLNEFNKIIRIILESQEGTYILIFSLFLSEEVISYLQTLYEFSYFDELLTIVAYLGVVELALIRLHTFKKSKTMPKKDKLRVCTWKCYKRFDRKTENGTRLLVREMLYRFKDRRYSYESIQRWCCFDESSDVTFGRELRLDFLSLLESRSRLSDAARDVFSAQHQVICQLLVDKCDKCKHEKYDRGSFVEMITMVHDTLKDFADADVLIEEFSDIVLESFEMPHLSSDIGSIKQYDDIQSLPFSLYRTLIKFINQLMKAFQVISRTKCSHVVFPSLSTTC